MASKFLVPLEVPNYVGTPADKADAGFALLYIKHGWVTRQDTGGVETDLVLRRPLDGFTLPANATEIVAADPLITALEKLQKSLLSITLTGDVTGTAAYNGGVLEIVTTGGAGGPGALVATAYNVKHYSAIGNEYLIGDVVYFSGRIYKALANNDAITPVPGGNAYWQDMGVGNQLRQTPADWDATVGDSQILNKPTLLSQFTNDSGYLTSFTETDPLFTASAAAGILSTDIASWNAAYGWGDHGTAGYLTAETDTLDSVTGRGNTTLNLITVGGITATGVTSTIYAGTGTRLRTEANNLVFERMASSGFMKIYINQTTLSPTAKAYMGYNNATLNAIFSNEHTSGGLELRTQDIIRQQIFTNGNIVIGAASPTDAGYKLDVAGTVRSQGALLANSTSRFENTMSAFYIATPATPTFVVSPTGGTMANGTYYYKIVAGDNTNGLTLPSAELVVVVSSGTGTASVTLSWTQTPNAFTWRVYKGTASNAQDRYFGINAITYTDTGSAGTLGTVPIENTTAVYQVSATALTVNTRILFSGRGTGIQLIDTTNLTTQQIIIGSNNGAATTGTARLTFGHNNSVNPVANSIMQLGTSNVATNASFGTFQIGFNNTTGVNGGTLYPILIGASNNFSPASALGGSPSGFLIGTGNTSTFATSSIMGWNNTATAENQLIFGYSQSNVSIGGYTDVYFGNGVRSGNQDLVGKAVTINSSGAGLGTDKAGGHLTLAGGKGTGTGAPGDVIISTATTLTTGSTLQSLTERLRVAATTGVVTVANLAGTGTRMVVASATGILSTQAIPSGSTGTVTSVAAITLGTTGTDLSSTVATNTTTPVITLNVPTASAVNRGALSAADWSTFNGKQAALNGTGFVKVSGTTVSYDNSTYYLASNPSGYTNNTGTVTSIALATGTTGTDVNVSGSPVTGSGTITLNIPDASSNNRGVMTIGTQSFNGAKTFISPHSITVANATLTNGAVSSYISSTYIPSASVSNRNLYGERNSMTFQLGTNTLSGTAGFNVTAQHNEVFISGGAGSTQPFRALMTTLVGQSGQAAMNIADFRYMEVKTPDNGGVTGHVVTTATGLYINDIQNATGFTTALSFGIYQAGVNDYNRFYGIMQFPTYSNGTTDLVLTIDLDGTMQVKDLSNFGLQAALNYDSVLSQNNLIDGGFYNFGFDNLGKFSVQSIDQFITLEALSASVSTAKLQLIADGTATLTSIDVVNSNTVIIELIPTEMRLQTPAVLSATATAGQFLKLVNATTGEVEFDTVPGGGGGISLTSLSATSPLQYNNTTGVFSILQASSVGNGFLSSTDWNTFNNKQNAITLTTTGTSGAATLITNTLNIPQYANTNIYNTNGSLTAARTLTLNSFILTVEQSGTQGTRFHTTGNVTIGFLNTTDDGTKLQVNGQAKFWSHIVPKANISMYSANTDAGPTNEKFIQAHWGVGSTYSLSIHGNAFAITDANGIPRQYITRIGSTSTIEITQTQDHDNLRVNSGDFVPISGGAIFNLLGIRGVINQTGTASGITRGLYIDPTLTSAVDFRAIETTAGTIKFSVLSGSGTRMVVADATGFLSTQTIPSGGSAYSVTTQTANHTVTATSGTTIVKGDTTGGTFSVTLPTAVGNTATIIIKKTAGTPALTVDAAGTETIDGGLTATINNVYESITLISDNANWQIV